MRDRPPARLMRILIGAALLLPLAVHAQHEGWYQVELLVFSYPGGGTAEQWDATPELAYPSVTQLLTQSGRTSATAQQTETATPPATAQTTPFATLPATEREFAGKADAMQRTGRYRILFHEAWLQPLTSQSAAVSVVLDQSGDGGQWPALQGTIKLYTSGDLHLDTNLWLNTQGEYLHNSWRMPAPPRGPASSGNESAVQTVVDETVSTVEVPVDTNAPGGKYPFRHAVLLEQSRHMRSGEVVYIDHPMLGVVAKITALSELEAGTTTPEPEPATPPKPTPPT